MASREGLLHCAVQPRQNPQTQPRAGGKTQARAEAPIGRTPSKSDQSGRGRVMAVLAEHAAAFPDLVPATLPERGLAGRDAALMHAIYDTAVRRWTTLEWMLCVCASRDVRELEPCVRAGLLAGAAQLMLLDRIPDHAAIDESVEWVKGARGKGAGGVVNAVLRKLSRLRSGGAEGEREIRPSWSKRRDEIPLADGRALGLVAPAFPEDHRARVAIATGISTWLYGRWCSQHGEAEACRIAVHALSAPPVIINASMARESVEFPVAGGGALLLSRHSAPGHFCVEGPREALVMLLEGRKDLWVQDPSSSAAIESVRDLRPGLIVDLCAGQGTKTRQLAATFPGAKIVATDTDRRRFATLEEEFAGSDQVSVVGMDAVDRVVGQKADLVLLDVPCSNTGVLGRRVEARHRAGPEQIRRLSELQGEIFDRSTALVSRTGAILYATCSIEAEENERLVALATSRHGCPVSRERKQLPSGGEGKSPTQYTDGSFSAMVTR